jgi:hypothetical protein
VLKYAFLFKFVAGILVTSLAFAGTPVIGIITASGHFTLERSVVWGNSTLFDGVMVETQQASSELALRNGAKVQLGGSSRAKVWENRVLLEKGVGQVAGPASYAIEAGGLKVNGAAPGSRVRVGLTYRVDVAALTGTARVVSGRGVVLASIPAGRHMSFSMQAAENAIVTRSGCLLYKDSHYILQDEDTQEIAEVSAPDLAANVGNRVEVTGTTTGAKPEVAGATIFLAATAIAQKSQGGCLSAASALDARTEVPSGSPSAVGAGAGSAPVSAAAPAVAAHTGLSTGAIVGIIAAGGGAAAAAGVLAMGKKSSTSP